MIIGRLELNQHLRANAGGGGLGRTASDGILRFAVK